MPIKITRKAFGNWLLSRGRSRVGLCGVPERCAIAGFIRHQTGGKVGAISVASYTEHLISIGEDTIKMPLWAQKFIQRWDAGDQRGRSGTASYNILKGIK